MLEIRNLTKIYEDGTLAVDTEFVYSATATNQNTTATNQNAGGGAAHNNLQPYQVFYIWRRVE